MYGSRGRETRAPQGTEARLTLSRVIAGLFVVWAPSGCLDRPLCTTECEPRTTDMIVETVSQKAVSQIDLLFMIDNSSSMSDKQLILRDAVPDLVKRLVSPNCVLPSGAFGKTESDPAAACPSGMSREFPPVKDIHVGVITSSLGDHGANAACPDSSAEDLNDHGRLITTRSRFAGALAAETADGGVVKVETPDPAGFLDWNPSKGAATGSIDAFDATFQAMVTATGEKGCGYESQLESVYRFLVDPAPPNSIELGQCPSDPSNACAIPTGIDKELLAQRAQFLRPNSLVAVILLTDENDCSIREGGPYYRVAQKQGLPPAVAICDTNPNDPCCRSCSIPTPKGCDPDPTCAARSADPNWAHDGDPSNLRCFDEKERFGVDFLYPTQRYVNALSKPVICPANPSLDPTQCPDLNRDGHPDTVTNPLFAGAVPREVSSVFLAGIVGVPWQDIATSSVGDLQYKTAKQMAAVDDDTWRRILGTPDPLAGPAVQSADVLMRESVASRSGMDGETPPVPAAPPNAGYLANPVNGHERTGDEHSDLQYACLFKLKSDRDCTNDSSAECDPCRAPGEKDNPLCQNEDGSYGHTLHYARAYPGLRELEVLHDFGDNSIVASICARTVDPSQTDKADYGYRPAVQAIVDRLKLALTDPCLPIAIDPVQDPNSTDPNKKKIPCSVIEARPLGGVGADPACDAAGRSPIDPRVVDPVIQRMKDQGLCGADGNCSKYYLCTLDEAGEDCHHEGGDPTDVGWCYVDPERNPTDDESLVAKCPASERRVLRFVDKNLQTPAPDGVALIACFGTSATSPIVAPVPARSNSSSSEAGP